jgi:hypothetical protein
VSAFLHSIIGASVFSRNSFTMPAVISAIAFPIVLLFLLPDLKKGAGAPFMSNAPKRA